MAKWGGWQNMSGSIVELSEPFVVGYGIFKFLGSGCLQQNVNFSFLITKKPRRLKCVSGDILILKCNLKKALYLLRPLYGSFCVEEMQAIFFRAEVCCILLRCFHSSTLNLNV